MAKSTGSRGNLSPKKSPSSYSSLSRYDKEVVDLAERFAEVWKRDSLPDMSQSVKAVGMFLLSLGDHITPGSAKAAKDLFVSVQAGNQVKAASVGTALSLFGYQIMDGSLSLYRKK